MGDANTPIQPRSARVASAIVFASFETPAGGAELRILIADDDPLVRSAVRALLADQPDLRVDGEAADGMETVLQAIERRPDVVLLDESIAGLDAMTVIQRIREAAPDVQVVVFSAMEDVDRGVAGLRSGATGFLLKEMSSEALLRALRGLAHGEAALSRSLTLRLVEQLQRDNAPPTDTRPVWSRLTPGEWHVLDLLGRGRTLSEAAVALSIPDESVREQVEQILLKLEVPTLDRALAAAKQLLAGEPWPSEGAPLDEVTRRRLDRQRPRSGA
jgi:DNA-binding NarL/FixJ family response regulator